METIERATVKRQPEFFRKIKDCESRGLKVKPGTSVTPAMIAEFEKTGKVTEPSVRKASLMELTTEDRAKILNRKLKEIADAEEKKARDVRQDQRHLDFAKERKIVKAGLCLVEKGGTEKTTLYR
jgi:hypothetical protein